MSKIKVYHGGQRIFQSDNATANRLEGGGFSVVDGADSHTFDSSFGLHCHDDGPQNLDPQKIERDLNSDDDDDDSQSPPTQQRNNPGPGNKDARMCRSYLVAAENDFRVLNQKSGLLSGTLGSPVDFVCGELAGRGFNVNAEDVGKFISGEISPESVRFAMAAEKKAVKDSPEGNRPPVPALTKVDAATLRAHVVRLRSEFQEYAKIDPDADEFSWVAQGLCDARVECSEDELKRLMA